MPPKPRRIQVDGDELVVLSGAAYDNLESQRRQVGAQNTRLRGLKTQLDQLGAFVDQVERAASALPECPVVPCAACVGTGQCAREALIAMLADRPNKR